MPRKRVRSASPEDQPSKKAKRATGKTSTNTTKATKATAQADTAEDDQNAAAEALVRKPVGRPAAGIKPSVRGRKKADDKAKTEPGEQANPDHDATKPKDGSLATATKTDDSIEVALDQSDSEEDATNVPCHVEGPPTQGRTSAGNKWARLVDVAHAIATDNITQDVFQAAGQEATTTAAGPLTPTRGHGPRSDGQHLGGDGGLSSCGSENTREEDHLMTGVPFHPIRWQRPVPSRVSAAGTTATTGAWAKPLAPKPMDALPTVEKRSSSPSLHGGDTVGSHLTEPLSEGDATHQQPPPSRQQETTTSAGVVTEQSSVQQPFVPQPFVPQPFVRQPSVQQPYIQQPPFPHPVHQPASQPMNVDSDTKPGEIHEPSGLSQAPQPVTVGSNTKPGETPKLFGHNTAPVHTTEDDPGPVPQNPAPALNVDVSQLPRGFFNSLEKFLNEDFPATSTQGLWLRGVQCGIGHGLATLKRIFLSEIEHRGALFGHPFPLDPGQTRSEQRRAIEANVMFDRLVANHAGETFMKSQSKWRTRRHHRHGSAAAAAAPPVDLFQQAPMTFGAPAGHRNPRSTPTPPSFPRFPTNPMGAGVLAAQGPAYPLYNPGFSRAPVGPWMNQLPNATATQNYNMNGAFPEFAAFPHGLPQLSTVWRGGEFPLASPQLTTTKDGRAVISMSRRQERDGEAEDDEAGDDEAGDDETGDDEAGEGDA